MRWDVDAAVEASAKGHEGAFLRRVAHEAGADRALMKRRVDRGRWIGKGGDVFVLAGWPDTPAQRRWVGLLAAGEPSHLSHECAADIHRIKGVRRGLVVVTVPHPLHIAIDGIQFHQLQDVRPHDIAVIDGLPVTTPTRTIIDLAAVISWTRLRLAVEHVVVERLSSFDKIALVLDDVRRQGKTGVSRLVSVLDHLDGEPPPASELERQLHRVAATAQLAIVRQFPLPWTREPVLGVVDAAVIESKLILEADGRSWHARLEQMAHDRRRDRAAAEAGWQTLRWVHADLVNDIAEAARSLRAIHLVRTRV